MNNLLQQIIRIMMELTKHIIIHEKEATIH